MSYRRPKSDPAPAPMYECLVGFAGAASGQRVSVPEGTLLRGDDPAVRAWPGHFLPVPFTADEKSRALAALRAHADRLNPIPTPEAVARSERARWPAKDARRPRWSLGASILPGHRK